MGELTASIAHEINQPLVGVVTNANASLRWLAATKPNLAEARKVDLTLRAFRKARIVGQIQELALKKMRATMEKRDRSSPLV